MNITLRKANALQHSINEAIRNIKIELNINLNEFQDVEAALAKANNDLVANDTRRQKLLMAFYNIRALVGTANAASGINTALAKAAFIDKRISQLENIANASTMVSLDVIKGKLDKIKNFKDEARSRVFGYGDTVSTSIVGQNQIDQAKAEILTLKKQKQSINDEVLELNIKTEVPLSEDTVKLLQEEGLL